MVQVQSDSASVPPATALRRGSLRFLRVSVVRESFLNFFFMMRVSFERCGGTP